MPWMHEEACWQEERGFRGMCAWGHVEGTSARGLVACQTRVLMVAGVSAWARVYRREIHAGHMDVCARRGGCRHEGEVGGGVYLCVKSWCRRRLA